jgi:hypothetical protein
MKEGKKESEMKMGRAVRIDGSGKERKIAHV